MDNSVNIQNKPANFTDNYQLKKDFVAKEREPGARELHHQVPSTKQNTSLFKNDKAIFDAQQADKQPLAEAKDKHSMASETPLPAKAEGEENQKPKSDFQKNLAELSQKISVYGAYASAGLHWFAAAVNTLSFGSGVQKFCDSIALNFTKALFTTTCALTGYQAFHAKRSWEFISRISEPVFFLFSKLEDMVLARGITLGLSQLVGANEKKLKDSGNEGKSWSIDTGENSKAFFEIMGEMFKGGLGENRRVLTGFTYTKIKQCLKDAIKTFSLGKSIKAFMKIFSKFEINTINRNYKNFLNISGLDSIRQIFVGDNTRDQGHTVALSAYIMMLGSFMGYFFGIKDKESPIYKFGGLLRNVGGAIADISLLGFPDVEQNLSGTFLGIATVLDAIQRFIPRGDQRLLNMVNNFAAGAYNIGVNLYLNRSNRKNKNEEIRFGDDVQKPVEQESEIDNQLALT